MASIILVQRDEYYLLFTGLFIEFLKGFPICVEEKET